MADNAERIHCTPQMVFADTEFWGLTNEEDRALGKEVLKLHSAAQTHYRFAVAQETWERNPSSEALEEYLDAAAAWVPAEEAAIAVVGRETYESSPHGKEVAQDLEEAREYLAKLR